MSAKKTYDGPIAAAGAPYSPVVEANGLVFISGQIPLDPKSRTVVMGDIHEQTKQTLDNLLGALKAAGCGPEDVLKTTIFLTDIGHYGIVNTIYGEVFHTNPPARSAVQVAALPFNVLIEIEAVAVKPD
ncbi:MAG: reactive intermediate/imine deaminase [Armatimonadetes bacterium]|nr:reactive intermediate/imine deaminase [Armatimonadota bacterium]HOC32158.1 Rid family detoxifying hydrolase [Armatimonadota bacterium]